MGVFRAMRWALLCVVPAAAQATISNPVLFVGQVPIADDSNGLHVTSAVGNQLALVAAAPRGGDLYIRYPNGTLRNLTREAGFGMAGVSQGASAIAVRDPALSFDASRAVFSMVIGAPTAIGGAENYVWQIYEMTGLQAGQTAVVTKLANQPAAYNNLYPNYLSDGSVVFVSDRPHNGQAHLYPLRDEYRTDLTTSGVWKLDTQNQLTLLDHSPSGDFRPFLDSFGRVLFTRWDHLQRDANTGNAVGAFDFASESPGAATQAASDLFPEPFQAPAGANYNGFEFNVFFPWMTRQDGSGEETLNHLGRHELRTIINKTFTDDPNLVVFNASTSGRPNPNPINNLFLYSEDPAQPGRYLGVDTQEFAMHGAGQLVALNAGPGVNPDLIQVQYLTARATATTQVVAGNIGHFRDPIMLSSGELLAASENTPGPAANLGTPGNPNPNYAFRLQTLSLSAGNYVPSAPLTAGISRSVQYLDPNQQVSWSGTLWELQPVEVVARSVPPISAFPALAAPEQQAFAQASVLPQAFMDFLRAQNLGLIVVRDTTSRDRADKQQPFNLRIPGGKQTPANPVGTVYDLAVMQYFQANMVRAAGSVGAPLPGRRARVEPLNDPTALLYNPQASAIAAGSQPIYPDGSVALMVPARRALTWQALAPDATPVLRERFWVTLQPGEVRVCDGCHGVNQLNQAGQPAATNVPQALTALLQYWTQQQQPLLQNGFE